MIRVTITGADDGVRLEEFQAMAECHAEIAEWGILLSAKRMGTPRYPSAKWLCGLRGLQLNEDVRFSAHLCGQIAREPEIASMMTALGRFDRAQVNSYDSGWPDKWRGFVPRLILQARGEEMLQIVANDAAQIGADVLFDPSGGKGVMPFRWPRAPAGVRTGFAGGITPDNVEDVISEIIRTGSFNNADFWIDMESGVRDAQDRFDWDKVARVLDTVKTINKRLVNRPIVRGDG